MKNKQANQILRAWDLAEKISGGELDKKAKWFSGDIRKTAYQKRESGTINEKISQNNQSSDQHVTISLLYLGEYKKQDLRDSIQNIRFRDTEMVQNRDPAKGYSVALIVNSAWSFQKIEVPYAAYFYLKLRQENIEEAMHGQQYDDFKSQLSQQLEEVIDRKRADLAECLALANQIVLKTFKLAGTRNVGQLRGLFQIQDEPPMLNSFYTEDIERVLQASADDSLLLKYLGLNPDVATKQEVDQNRDFISKLLDVENLPDGRWPGPEKYFQSLMQQVAVNVIRDKGPIKTDLKTVNGPPGTGKTTLLQDVFADTIVQQAKVMAQLEKPMDGFRRIKPIELFSNCKYNAYELIPALQGYGIVVTSNNNSAVANISKEFPSRNKIRQYPNENREKQDEYRTQLEEIDYFSDLANRILETADSWGMFAVPMGSKANQQKVFKHINHGVLKKQLSVYSDSWADARQNFNTALEAVHQEKARLHRMISIVERANPSVVDQAYLELKVVDEGIEVLNQEIANLTQKIENIRHRLVTLPKKDF